LDYRVKDFTMERPFWHRLFGLSTLVVLTSDRSHPEIRIEAVRDAFALRDAMRSQVEYLARPQARPRSRFRRSGRRYLGFFVSAMRIPRA